MSLHPIKKKIRKILKKRYGRVIPVICGGTKLRWNFHHPVTGSEHWREVEYQWRHEKAPLCWGRKISGYQSLTNGMVIEADSLDDLKAKLDVVIQTAVDEGTLDTYQRRRPIYEKRIIRL